MHSLLEMDCIPAGMEMFPAANEDQMTLIKGVIDQCDFYLVVTVGDTATCQLRESATPSKNTTTP